MKKNGIAGYLSNLRLVFFAYAVVIIVGVYAWMTLPREEMPSINIPVTLVSTVLPGASPQDVEQLLTRPIEDKIRGVSGIDYVRSTSMENASIVIIMFKDDAGDPDELTRKVKEKVDSVDLPDNANTPTVMKMDFDELPVWTFAISGEDKVGLRRLAEKLEKQLERQATIDRVEITGIQEREVVVHMDQADITKYGVNPAVLASNLAAATTNVPAGSINLGDYSYSVSLAKEVSDIDSLRAMTVILNGVEYHLSDIAHVYEQEKPGNTNSYQLRDGEVKQVITLNVYKTAGSDIEANARLARQVAEDVMSDYPQFELTNITDVAQEIDDTFDRLYNNIYATIALVFVVMFVFLGIREAAISAISIPLVMLVTFAGIMFSGMTLNFITLFGLLIALGMLVDNAIVVTTALSRSYFERREQGITALQAGVDVWKEFFVALISTNLTTIWAFLPLLIMTGVMGQMVAPVGIVVTVAMLASAMVAFLLSLPLGIYILEPYLPVRVQKLLVALVMLTVAGLEIYFLPKNWTLLLIIPVTWLLMIVLASLVMRLIRSHQQKKPQNAKRNFLVRIVQDGFVSTTWLEQGYQKIIAAILQTRSSMITTIVCIVIITIVSFSMPLLGWVHSEFFPKEEADSFQATWTLPTGTNSDEADRVARELLPQLAEGVPDLEYITAEVGRTTASSIASGGNSNKILFTFNLIPEKKRHSSSIQTAADFRARWKNNAYGTVDVSEVSTVSTGGSDLSMYIVGDDLNVLAAKAQEMEAWLAAQPGVVDIKSDLDSTSKRLVFYPHAELSAEYGLSNTSLAVLLRSALSGWTLGTLKLNENDDKDTDIVLRQQTGIPDMTNLDNIQVPISGVGYVPLESLGEVRVEPSLASIYRYDYQHAVQVNASVMNGYSSTEINQAFEHFVDTELNLPQGYSRKVAGTQDVNNKALVDLSKAMVVAFALILITLVIQLRSFRKAFIVMSVIPVAISGVFINFALLGWSLNLPAIIGILSLFGIVVNNSILIIERINQNLDEKMPFQQAVIEGCVSRLQPILLTSLTTIIGLLPITLSDPLWQGLGGTIICGLTFSGILLLFFIPALFVLMFEPKHRGDTDAQWYALLDQLSQKQED